MVIFVLGSRGMAGHVIYNYFKNHTSHTTFGIAREKSDFIVDVENNLEYLEYLLLEYKPDIVINCIGVLLPDSNKNICRTIYINSFFPHWLEKITKETNTKIIHLSTNCVFKEDRGNYLDTDIPDCDTWYARTKAMGEITNNKDLTIRLSIIGEELKENGSGLFAWFMKQKGTIKGFNQCFWNGISCLCLAQNIEKIIEANVIGLYQLAPSYSIDKYSLCLLFKKIWNKDIIIEPNDSIKKNGTLINSYREEFKPIFPKDYETMLIEMKEFMEKNNE
jgi:dTDP-4-dehydrorhamnose reductase